MHSVATLTQSTLKFQHLNMSEYMMETDEDYKREETSKQVYEFYSCNKLKYRKLCKEFDEDEMEVDVNTTQERYTKEIEYGASEDEMEVDDNTTQDHSTRKRKHEDDKSQVQHSIKRKCDENEINVDELTKMFESMSLNWKCTIR